MTYIDIQDYIQESNFLIDKIVDGDTIGVIGIVTGEKREIRLLGIDVPETRKGRKLRVDEEKTRIAGTLLQQMGNQVREFLKELCPTGTAITLCSEAGNDLDYYGRYLAYVILPDGTCLNDILIEEGYAKPLEEYPCNESPKYRLENWKARRNKKGLYGFYESF